MDELDKMIKSAEFEMMEEASQEFYRGLLEDQEEQGSQLLTEIKEFQNGLTENEAHQTINMILTELQNNPNFLQDREVQEILRDAKKELTLPLAKRLLQIVRLFLPPPRQLAFAACLGMVALGGVMGTGVTGIDVAEAGEGDPEPVDFGKWQSNVENGVDIGAIQRRAGLKELEKIKHQIQNADKVYSIDIDKNGSGVIRFHGETPGLGSQLKIDQGTADLIQEFPDLIKSFEVGDVAALEAYNEWIPDATPEQRKKAFAAGFLKDKLDELK